MLTGDTVNTSEPSGVPVTLKNILITVSPPAKAVADPSAALSFFLTLEMVGAVAEPLVIPRLRSEASKPPLPPFVLYTPWVKVTSM